MQHAPTVQALEQFWFRWVENWLHTGCISKDNLLVHIQANHKGCQQPLGFPLSLPSCFCVGLVSLSAWEQDDDNSSHLCNLIGKKGLGFLSIPSSDAHHGTGLHRLFHLPKFRFWQCAFLLRLSPSDDSQRHQGHCTAGNMIDHRSMCARNPVSGFSISGAG